MGLYMLLDIASQYMPRKTSWMYGSFVISGKYDVTMKYI